MTADLSALIARLEAAEEVTRDLAVEFAAFIYADPEAFKGAVNYDPELWVERNQSPLCSLDAALALAERVLGNGPCVLHRNGPNEWGFTYVDDDTAYAATPALSMCAAILRAKQGEG